jgi:hypothetical protein
MPSGAGEERPVRQASRTRRIASLSHIPPWISAVAAIGSTILVAVGVFGLVGRPVETPSRVTLESVLVAAEQVEGQGTFENVDPRVNEVVFVGRPRDLTDEGWLAAEGALSPSAQLGTLQSGSWTASRPAPLDVPYRWYAILWPAAAGAGGFEDLVANGPESEFVVAKSDPVDTP